MPKQLADTFRRRIATADNRLVTLTEDTAAQPYPSGKWLRKEVLGHLLDSAANNHVRFAVAALTGSYTGPEYDGEGWVRLHEYAQLPYSELLRYWRSRNELLVRLVEGIPESSLNAECRIGNGEHVTLKFLIEDYLDHLEHHVKQIAD